MSLTSYRAAPPCNKMKESLLRTFSVFNASTFLFSKKIESLPAFRRIRLCESGNTGNSGNLPIRTLLTKNFSAGAFPISTMKTPYVMRGSEPIALFEKCRVSRRTTAITKPTSLKSLSKKFPSAASSPAPATAHAF